MTNLAAKVRYGDTVYGSPCYVDVRTAAHLDYTKNALASQHPGCKLVILQGCFNTTVAASAGTHDKTSVVDAEIVGMGWDDAQTFMRTNGWACWHRTPAQGFSAQHLHQISLGYGSAPVGVYVPGQVADYYAHRTGLVGHAADPSWHPKDIAGTVFNYDNWENDMGSPKTWDADDWKAIGANLPKLIWNFKPAGLTVTMRSLVVETARKMKVLG